MKTMYLFGYHNFVATHAHDVWLHTAGTNERKSGQQANQKA